MQRRLENTRMETVYRAGIAIIATPLLQEEIFEICGEEVNLYLAGVNRRLSTINLQQEQDPKQEEYAGVGEE